MLDEKKVMEKINSMPIEELVEILKKALDDSHMEYTIEEGGQIIWCGLGLGGEEEERKN